MSGKNETISNLITPESNKIFYPHLKITGEKFPRLLATRKFANPNDEYFGAFLPKTALRIWLYHLNKTFRLRSCQLEIDGTFPQPCEMFFLKKCVAPCVASICSKNEYDDYVKALSLFLGSAKSDFESFVIGKIDEFSEALEFEKAARWRDIWHESQNLLSSRKYEVTLENAVDTYSFEEIGTEIIFYLITTRGRKFLGNKEFAFSKSEELTKENFLESIIKSFYQFHAPREIRVPFDFAERKSLERGIREKFKTPTKIAVIKQELNKTAQMRLIRTKNESGLKKLRIDMDAEKLSASIQSVFDLKRSPQRIEAFDVAHIANQDFITANSVWEKDEFRREKTNYWKSDAQNEPEAMAKAVKARLLEGSLPDLILIDGGKGQLNAVLNSISEGAAKKIAFISAVKPSGKHREISHFLTAEGKRIDFVPGERVFELLRNLRDEAHRLANELHRQERSNKYIFSAKDTKTKASQDLPLIIIRFDEPDGAAEDLQPIRSEL